jgi:hypothetical protein
LYNFSKVEEKKIKNVLGYALKKLIWLPCESLSTEIDSRVVRWTQILILLLIVTMNLAVKNCFFEGLFKEGERRYMRTYVKRPDP